VVQTDLNRAFLNVAKDSYAHNRWPVVRADFRTGDFFEVLGELKRQDALFDCVFLDPPFFSTTDKGTVDLENDFARVINKVRPLIGDGGRLVAINNALFVPGAAYMKQLEALCADGYLELEELIPIAEDFTGTPETRIAAPPTDPAPFNHPTKISVLRAKRKDGRKAR
jgi:23S rRNA (cytosine1962-C5)-methyltransferase